MNQSNKFTQKQSIAKIALVEIMIKLLIKIKRLSMVMVTLMTLVMVTLLNLMVLLQQTGMRLLGEDEDEY